MPKDKKLNDAVAKVAQLVYSHRNHSIPRYRVAILNSQEGRVLGLVAVTYLARVTSNGTTACTMNGQIGELHSQRRLCFLFSVTNRCDSSKCCIMNYADSRTDPMLLTLVHLNSTARLVN